MEVKDLIHEKLWKTLWKIVVWRLMHEMTRCGSTGGNGKNFPLQILNFLEKIEIQKEIFLNMYSENIRLADVLFWYSDFPAVDILSVVYFPRRLDMEGWILGVEIPRATQNSPVF